MIRSILEWKELVLLVLLGWLLRTLVSRIYRTIAARLDRKVPDHMPMAAGDWILKKAFPLGIRVIETSANEDALDAYFPSAKTIVLSFRTYEKRDPSFWAVAAHEFGHALVHRASLLVRLPSSLARVVQRSATELATLLVAANVLYGRGDIDRWAFALLWASLGAYVLVMLDEAAASFVAYRILSREEAMSRGDLVAAVTLLAAAFMTYVAGFAGQVLLVLERDFVISKLELGRHFTPGPPIESTRLPYLGAISVVLVGMSLRELVRAVKRPDFGAEEDVKRARAASSWRDVVRGLLGVAAVALVWDRAAGPWLPLVCVAGIVASRPVLRFVASIGKATVQLVAFVVGAVLVVGWILAVRPKPAEKREEPADQPPAYTIGNTRQLSVELANDPPWYERFRALAFPALHVAFVVGLWIELFSSH